MSKWGNSICPFRLFVAVLLLRMLSLLQKRCFLYGDILLCSQPYQFHCSTWVLTQSHSKWFLTHCISIDHTFSLKQNKELFRRIADSETTKNKRWIKSSTANSLKIITFHVR